MKKRSSGSRYPTASSLRELPEIDFDAYRVARNPFAAKVRRTGIEIVHEDPTAESLAEIPAIDLTTAKTRGNPYARRIAAEGTWIQVGRGRPRKGEEIGPTSPRSVRLPASVWKALEAEAQREHVSVHAVLRYAVVRFLDELPRTRATERRRRTRR